MIRVAAAGTILVALLLTGCAAQGSNPASSEASTASSIPKPKAIEVPKFESVAIPATWSAAYPAPDMPIESASSSEDDAETSSLFAPVANRKAAKAWVAELVGAGWTVDSEVDGASTYTVTLTSGVRTATAEVFDAIQLDDSSIGATSFTIRSPAPESE